MSKNEWKPKDEMCLSCGGTVEVKTFYDGDEFDCTDCGARHMWNVMECDDAYLTLLDTDWRPLRDKITELEKQIESTECCGNCKNAFLDYDGFGCKKEEELPYREFIRDDNLPIQPWTPKCKHWEPRK